MVKPGSLMMTWRNSKSLAFGLIFGGLLLMSQTVAKAQETKAARQDSLAVIDEDFASESLKLEKVRLERIAKLAASKTGAESDRAYEAYFRAAIANNLYAEAEATAEKVMNSKTASPQAAMMAQLVNVIAEANRGAFRESLSDLEAAVKANNDGQKSVLPLALKLTLVDAYVQRLVQGGQFDIARQVLESIQGKANEPSVKELAAQWLKQVELVGKVAPPIDGKDVDGKPYHLAEAKGDMVLVVFWATWCLANAQEVAAFDETYSLYRGKGLRVVGVNLDTFSDESRSLEAVVPGVKRFLIEHNVRWPNLIDHPGEGELAKAYGVKDIPANVLIGRDGKVVQINLTRANLKKVLAKEMAK
jgi:peroxiredoxin